MKEKNITIQREADLFHFKIHPDGQILVSEEWHLEISGGWPYIGIRYRQPATSGDLKLLDNFLKTSNLN